MRNFSARKVVAGVLGLFLLSQGAATAASVGSTTTFGDVRVKRTLRVDGATTQVGNQTFSGNVAVGGTLAATGATTLGSTLAVTGATTVGSTLGVTGALSLTVPLTKANANTSVKRQTMVWYPASNVAGGTLADGATYRGFLPIGRAATITQVNCLCGTASAGGTSTIKVLKASSSGNTMLSAATLDPNTLVANTITSPTLTATGADLAVTAAQGVYLEWVTGTQTTDAVNCSIAVEYELDDI